MITSFLIPGAPKAKARPKVNTKTHKAYTPKSTRDYEDTVKYSYLSAFQPQERFHIGSIRVEMTAYYPIPTSWNKRKRLDALSGDIYPEVRPDADNCAKAVLDALNGIAYRDDASVVDLIVHKRYAEVGHVVVKIESGGDIGHG